MGEGAEKKQDNPAIGRMKLPFVMVVDWNSGDLKDNMDKPALRGLWAEVLSAVELHLPSLK